MIASIYVRGRVKTQKSRFSGVALPFPSRYQAVTRRPEGWRFKKASGSARFHTASSGIVHREPGADEYLFEYTGKFDFKQCTRHTLAVREVGAAHRSVQW